MNEWYLLLYCNIYLIECQYRNNTLIFCVGKEKGGKRRGVNRKWFVSENDKKLKIGKHEWKCRVYKSEHDPIFFVIFEIFDSFLLQLSSWKGFSDNLEHFR